MDLFCQYFWLVVQPEFVSLGSMGATGGWVPASGLDPYIDVEFVFQGMTYLQWYAALCG